MCGFFLTQPNNLQNGPSHILKGICMHCGPDFCNTAAAIDQFWLC